jgi:hypothetical protein
MDDMKNLPSLFLTSFALDEIERLRLRVMAVTVLIESEIALKPERWPLGVAFHSSCSQKGEQRWPVLAGRTHDGTERHRILSDAQKKSLPRPHRRIGPSLTSAGRLLSLKL